MKRNILVVDDSRAVHALIREFLKDTGFTQIDVFDGKQAIDLLATPQGEDVGLVLLDWEMPVMNGPETLKIIRTQGKTLPVVVMTTKNKEEDIAFMLGEGADEYMMKPFTQDIFVSKLEEFLGVA